MQLVRKSLILVALSLCLKAYGQDVDFHITDHFLPGKTFIKIKQDFYDPYVWALTSNNRVFRINGITKQVDDLTASFSVYGNLKFIDIAGRSKDTVFIATNSSVLQYKNGIVKMLTSANKLPPTLNSIGIEKPGSLIFTRNLLIGSDKGLYKYDMDVDKTAELYYEGATKLYEATYRNEMYKDSLNKQGAGDTINYQPVTMVLEDVRAKGFLWTGGKTFGKNIYTATCITASLYQFGPLVSYSSAIWGTEKGLFELNADGSFNSDFPHNHYLPDIKVNKVTTIYGLIALGNAFVGGDASIIKHNLLAGTEKGFFYTSSFYENAPNGMHILNFFHYNDLGDLTINDLSVNTSSTNRPICDDGVWLATVDGIYLLTPDYSRYFNNAKAKAIYFKGLSQNLSETSICSGNLVVATINKLKYSSNIIEWYMDNVRINGEAGDELKITKPGTYHAVIHDPCSGIRIESEPLKVTVISSPVFSFNYPDKLEFCTPQQVKLETTANPIYNYRWLKNDVLIPGATGPSISFFESGRYRVEVSACTGDWVSSKEVKVVISDLPEPQIITEKTSYCQGEDINITSNLVADPAYTINWMRNGIIMDNYKNLVSIHSIPDGAYTVAVSSNISTCLKTSAEFTVSITSSPVFTFNYPDIIKKCAGEMPTLGVTGPDGYKYRWYKNNELTGDQGVALVVSSNGKYKVEVSACPETWVVSKEVTVDFIELPQPVLNTDKPSYCMGDVATINLNIPINNTYTINWFRDNQAIPEYKNKTSILTMASGIYTVKIVSDEISCEKTSTGLQIYFESLPSFTIQRTVKTTLCDGQDVELKVSSSGGSVKWSTGETAQQISISTSGIYSATVINAGGCENNQQMSVEFYPVPKLALADVSLCSVDHEIVTLTAPAGFVKYLWNNQVGSATFLVSEPQLVTLSVIDQNGCRATQEINVASNCMKMKFPNTFTPNGDGINDTWNIDGLENDQTATVSVYTRYGTKVFESKGYSHPWNGTFQGKRLPSGVYYYVIKSKFSVLPFSGPLTIIY